MKQLNHYVATALTGAAALCTDFTANAQTLTYDRAFDAPRDNGYLLMVDPVPPQDLSKEHLILLTKSDSLAGNTTLVLTVEENSAGHLAADHVTKVAYIKEDHNGNSEIIETGPDKSVHKILLGDGLDKRGNRLRRVKENTTSSFPADKDTLLKTVEAQVFGGKPVLPRPSDNVPKGMKP